MDFHKIKNWPRSMRIRFFWLILSLCLAMLIGLWVFLDTPPNNASVTGEIQKRSKESKEYWKQQLKVKD